MEPYKKNEQSNKQHYEVNPNLLAWNGRALTTFDGWDYRACTEYDFSRANLQGFPASASHTRL